MGRKSNDKVSTSGGDALGDKAFSGLDLEGLPEGRTSPDTSAGGPPRADRSADRGRVEIRREKAGRAGKTVTTLRAFPSHVPLRELEVLAQSLKKRCACGGALKGRVIELQGEVIEPASKVLEAAGFRPVRAGG